MSTITTFDRLGRAIQVKNPEGSVAKNEYDREWNVRFVRDFKSQLVSERSYTSRGELARAISHQDPAQNAVTVYKQNENSDVTQVIELAAPNNLDEDPANRITTTNYDVRRNAYKSTLADGTYTRTYFDKVDIAVYSETRAPNNVFMSAGATVVGSRGETTKSVSLDDALASSDITWLTGETTGTEPTWTSLGIVSYPFYDADLVSIAGRDELNNTFGTSLDKAKRPVYPVDALGKVTGKREYNNDSVTTVVKAQKPDDTNALIAVATNTVNARGEITQTLDYLNYTAKVTHNGFSQAAKLEDRNAATTDIAYDNMLRQYTVTQHVGASIGDVQLTKFYDANSNLNQINDPRGKVYLFTHSTDNRVKQSTNPVITSGPDVGKQNNEKVRYSALGELLAHQDANGKVAAYRNDKLGRPVKEVHVLPNPAMDILAEDDCTFYAMLDYPTAFGELKAQIDTAYEFLLIEDPLGQFKPREVVTRTLTQGSTTIAEEQTSNPQGQLIKERTLVNSSQVFSITYEYNSVGLKSKSVSTNAGTHEYTYDANLRLDLVKRNTTETIADFDYTIGGLKKKVTLLNGVVIDYTYTDRSELKRITATKSPNTLGDIEITQRDGNGNIKQIVYHHLSNTTADFTYEPVVDWLKTETWTGQISYSATYSHDDAGNRISATKGSNVQKMSFDDENRLIEEIFGTSTQVTGHDYQNVFIDVNGNESAQTNPEVCATPSSGISGPTVRKFTSDNNGNVTKIETLLNGGVDLTENLSYAFDNRMIGYTKTGSSSASNTYLFSTNRNRINNQNVSANTTEWYYYDGSDVIEEFTQSGSGSQNFANSYVNALGIDSKVCRITAGGTKFYYGQDHIGTNAQTYNSDGTLNSNFVTTAWGEPLSGFTTDRYGFTQREKDSESSFNYFRARMYEPKLGRFLGKDIVKKWNRYIYGMNNPLTTNDPTGMQDKKEKSPGVSRQTPYTGEWYTCTCERNFVGDVLEGLFGWVGNPKFTRGGMFDVCTCHISKEKAPGVLVDIAIGTTDAVAAGFRLVNAPAEVQFAGVEWETGKSVEINSVDVSKGEIVLRVVAIAGGSTAGQYLSRELSQLSKLVKTPTSTLADEIRMESEDDLLRTFFMTDPSDLPLRKVELADLAATTGTGTKDIILYHGTTTRSAMKITGTGLHEQHTFFAERRDVAKLFAFEAGAVRNAKHVSVIEYRIPYDAARSLGLMRRSPIGAITGQSPIDYLRGVPELERCLRADKIKSFNQFVKEGKIKVTVRELENTKKD